MNILVAGASGQVGRELARLGGAGINIIGAARPEIDLTVPDTIETVMRRAQPAVVVNAAAYTAVDQAERESALADMVNRDGTAHLARASATRGVPMIHLSTDYVFDGSKAGPYLEDDPVAPINAYGRSKEAGERVLREILAEHVILRTAWVYSPFGQNFVKTMLRLGAERAELRVVGDQRGCPTSARSIARAVLMIARRLAEGADEYGTFHFVGGGETHWHGFAAAIFEGVAARGSRVPRLIPIPTDEYPTPARRPRNSVLDCGKVMEVYGVAQPPWRDELDDCLNSLLDGGKAAA